MKMNTINLSFFTLLIMVGLAFMSCKKELNEANQNETAESEVKEYPPKSKVVFLIDPTIYQIRDSLKLKKIKGKILLALRQKVKVNKDEVVLWLIDQNMINQGVSAHDVFIMDRKTKKEKEKYKDLERITDLFYDHLVVKWKEKHKDEKVIYKKASCIIESLFVINNKIEEDHITDLVIISDMLQESHEYDMELENLSSFEEIIAKFEQARIQLGKYISMDFSSIENISIYQVPSHRISTTEKAIAIKKGWLWFFENACKIDSEKVDYFTPE